jgi:uncharacterized linocin/CFP29 family protein
MAVEFIYKQQGSGDVADRLLASGMDTGVLRPFVDGRGRNCVKVFNRAMGKEEVQYTNAPATLRKDQWMQMDEAVLRAARPMLRVWGDIVGAGLTYNIPNGMSVTVLQHQTMTDAGNATLSMDGLRQAERDRPQFDIGNLPLPIVHGDFHFSLREIAVSQGQGMPLDTTMVEQTTRKCVEQIEKLTLGTTSSYTYGGGTVYGLTNFPARLTKTLTNPTAVGWTPETLNNEVLDMIQAAQDVYFNGPYMVWYSPAWTKYLYADYSAAYPGVTTMDRLRRNDDVRIWRKADYLSGYRILLVQMTSDVIQAVTGMRLRTLQWDSHGGMQKNFKVMGIMVPRLRSNSDGNTGIVDGVAP